MRLCRSGRFLCPTLSSPETLEFRAHNKPSDLSPRSAAQLTQTGTYHTPSVTLIIDLSGSIQPTARRSLLLLCKFLQQLGNEVLFETTGGGENEHMSFLNDLLQKMRPNMRKFFDEITVRIISSSRQRVVFLTLLSLQDIKGCSALPLSPFGEDVAMRSESCRVLRHLLVNAREYLKTKYELFA